MRTRLGLSVGWVLTGGGLSAFPLSPPWHAGGDFFCPVLLVRQAGLFDSSPVLQVLGALGLLLLAVLGLLAVVGAGGAGHCGDVVSGALHHQKSDLEGG